MKSLILIAFLLTSLLSGFPQNKYPRVIKIAYVDFSIETIFRISCNYFDKAFSKDEYKLLQIKKDSDLITFGNSLHKFIKVKSNGIDVRGKIEYVICGRNFRFCFDQFGVFSDGINYYRNISLIKLLRQKIPDFIPYWLSL